MPPPRKTKSQEELAACLPPTLAAATTVKFNAGQFVSHRRKEKISKFYKVRKALGSGGYGEVFLAGHLESGTERAIKVIDRSRWNSHENDAVINEFNIVKDLDHPNLLKMYEMFEDKRHFYIVTDIYKGGELFDEIEKHGAFPEEDAAVLMLNVLSCVNYCHKKNIVHRDLKPENVLLTKSKKLEDLKVIDFGLAAVMEPMERLHDSVGSSYYKAPEVLNENYCEKCDIWSCGVICFILLGGYAPFDGDDDRQIEDAILDGEFEFDDPIWDDVSEDAKDFIEECLTYSEKDRPNAAEALSHPWLEKYRKEGQQVFVRAESDIIKESLENMAKFHAHSKLKQATLAFIASQLLKREERETIDEVFRALDRNSDGKLTKDEIKIGYAEFYGKDLTNDEIDQIFHCVDFRGTGAIDYSEFIVASMFEKDLLDDTRLMAAFKMFDSDGDGYIDGKNIKKVLSKFGAALQDGMDEYINNKIVAEFDHDGDGKISYDDFKTMMFQTVKTQPKHRRRSFISAVEKGGALGSLTENEMPLPQDLCVTSGKEGTPKTQQRRGSIKDVQNAFQAMSVFDHAMDASSASNPIFKPKTRFASVRGSKNRPKSFPSRTTTRETIAVNLVENPVKASLIASYTGALPFSPEDILQDGGGGLLTETDEEGE